MLLLSEKQKQKKQITGQPQEWTPSRNYQRYMEEAVTQEEAIKRKYLRNTHPSIERKAQIVALFPKILAIRQNSTKYEQERSLFAILTNTKSTLKTIGNETSKNTD